MINLWKVIGITAVVGVFFTITGLFLGANTGGMQIGRDGIQVGSSELMHVHHTGLDAFDNISVNVSSMRVRIARADYFGFEAHYRNTSSFSYSIHGNTLTVHHNINQVTVMGGVNWNLESLTIFIPHNAVLNDVNLHSSSGRIIIEDLNCVTFTANSSSGRADINNLTATAASARSSSGRINVSSATVDEHFSLRSTSGRINVDNSSAEHFDIRTTSGRIIARRVLSGGFDAESSSGRIDLQGVFGGGVNARASSGRINVDIDGAESDFNVIAQTSSGSVRINSRQGVNIVNNNADNDIVARTSSGGIRIDFAR